MIITCQHRRNGEDEGQPEVFYGKSEVREELSDGLVMRTYRDAVFAWMDSDPDDGLTVDLSLAGSGVTSEDRWELHTG